MQILMTCAPGEGIVETYRGPDAREDAIHSASIQSPRAHVHEEEDDESDDGASLYRVCNDPACECAR